MKYECAYPKYIETEGGGSFRCSEFCRAGQLGWLIHYPWQIGGLGPPSRIRII